MRLLSTAVTLAASLAFLACEAPAPVELRFDRSAASVADHPFPTDLYRDADTGVLLSFSEAQVARMFFLNHLALTFQRGWSTATPIRLPFTPAPSDPDRWVDPAGAFDGVRVYRVDVDPPQRVPIETVDFNRRTGSLVVRTATLVPGRFGVVALAGRLFTRGGDAVTASADYRRVQREGDPATDEGFARVAATDPDIGGREDSLAYFEFTTVDHASELALLHAYVNGALPVDRRGADEVVDLTSFTPAATRELSASPGVVVADSPAAVQALFEASGLQGVPTAGIARVTAGQLSTPNFVSDVVLDPLALPTNGTLLGRTPNLPFAPAGALGPDAPANPLSLSASAPFRTVPFLAFWPQAPADGGPLPVVIGLHGFATFKETWMGFASAVTASGRALVVIDNYQHGARAADIDVPEGDFAGKVDEGVLALAGRSFPDPFLNPTFPARTRDKVRQSLCDQLSLVRLVAAADGTDGRIDLDGDGQPDHLGPIDLVGTSLGAMMGLQMLAVSPVIRKAVLNVPGGGLPTIVRDAPNIDADVRMLLLATANVDGFGLLSGTSRRMLNDSPEREIYDIVLQTVVAPIDPLTFAPHLPTGALRAAALPPGAPIPRPSYLMQFVAGDLTVPNSASARLTRAIAAFLERPGDLLHVVDKGEAKVLFDLGLTAQVVTGTDFPPASVSQFQATRPEVMPEGLAWDGGHKALWLWLDPQVTAAMQDQALRFLASGGDL